MASSSHRIKKARPKPRQRPRTIAKPKPEPKPSLSVAAIVKLFSTLFPEILNDADRLTAIRDVLQSAAKSATQNEQEGEEQEEEIIQPLGKLTLESIIHTFSLRYSEKRADFALHNDWSPEDDTVASDVKDHEGNGITSQESELIGQALPHLDRWLYLYEEIAVRRSEAICRMPTDQVLLEAIGILGGHSATYTLRQQARPKHSRRPTPTIYTRIQLFAEMDLSFSQADSSSAAEIAPTVTAPTKITYTGRLDYSIGIQGSLRPPTSTGLIKPAYTSILIVIEAKRQNRMSEARQQLLAYVGCLNYARRTAGFKWIFLKISHEGIVQFALEKDVRAVGWSLILQTIIIILKHSVLLQIPQNSPLKDQNRNPQWDNQGLPAAVLDDREWLLEGSEFVDIPMDSESEGEM